MSLSFSKAGCGEEICLWDSKPLHSTFNPVKEAQRFVSFLNFSNPSFIIFLGPCLPFCVPFIREKYPQTKLIAIQYFSGLPSKEDFWDYDFILSDAASAGEKLYSIIGEEHSNTVEIISWNTSERLFHNLYITACEAVKFFLAKSRDVLGTRIFFSKRWFKNSIHFFSNVSKICLPVCGNSPVLITASGPSLDACIPAIIEHRESLFIIALSSSLSSLSHHQIIPDLCVSTDGGFWAKTHLSVIHNLHHIPLAVSAESCIPKNILTDSVILPLNYGDSFSDVLFKAVSMPYTPGVRNGTVSGTALFLAKLFTTGPVFFAGLDLSAAKGFQHSQPNLIEKNAEIKDTRILNSQTRSSAHAINSRGSLLLYEQWFRSLPLSITQNIYRLKPSSVSLNNRLGTIEDICIKKFISLIKDSKDLKPSFKYLSLDNCHSILKHKIDALHSFLQGITYKDVRLTGLSSEVSELAKSVSLQKYMTYKKFNNEETFNNLIYELKEIIQEASSLQGVEK
ncbi:MAG TPA: DUF115 domain-containing protein [Treponemataceae bacterium]|nr:DUF115 domain-containing protein [Treponemataceae bacterium]